MEIIWRIICYEEGRVRMGEKVQGLRSMIGRYQIDRGLLSIV